MIYKYFEGDLSDLAAAEFSNHLKCSTAARDEMRDKKDDKPFLRKVLNSTEGLKRNTEITAAAAAVAQDQALVTQLDEQALRTKEDLTAMPYQAQIKFITRFRKDHASLLTNAKENFKAINGEKLHCISEFLDRSLDVLLYPEFSAVISSLRVPMEILQTLGQGDKQPADIVSGPEQK